MIHCPYFTAASTRRINSPNVSPAALAIASNRVFSAWLMMISMRQESGIFAAFLGGLGGLVTGRPRFLGGLSIVARVGVPG